MQLNYGQILQAGQQLVPNLRQQMVQDAVLDMQKRRFQMQEDALQRQLAEQERAQQKEQEFIAARDDALLSGDPRAMMDLRLRFPEYTKSMKDAFDALEEDEKERSLTTMGTIFARGQAGDLEGAAAVLEERVKADRAAGEPDARDEAILAGLQSDNPIEQKAALAEVGIVLASIEPDKFGEVYGKLNPDDKKPSIQRDVEYYRSIGRDDLADQLLENKADPLVQITGPAGTSIIPRSQALGGTPRAQQGGGGPSGSDGLSGPALGAFIENNAVQAVPGLQVTSRRRSPFKNRQVGGTENSFHLTDEARDFVPPSGMSMGQLHQRLKQALPGFDVINEGDHVHVEPSSRSSGPVSVRTVQEANKLAPGTRYITPDGREFIR